MLEPDPCYPASLAAVESAMVKLRRERCNGVPENEQTPDEGSDPESLANEYTLRGLTSEKEDSEPGGPVLPADCVGLAFSGGGIRSATFCLGVLQSLSRSKVLPLIDFLSTVSGGGYTGSMLGRLFMRKWIRIPGYRFPETSETWAPSGNLPHERVEHALNDGNSPVVSWLRNCGRYLSASGSGGMLGAVAMTLRNWMALQVCILVTLLAIFLIIRAATHEIGMYFPDRVQASISQMLSSSENGSGFWKSPLWLTALALITCAAMPLGLAYWLVPSSFIKKRKESKNQWGPLIFTLLLGIGISTLAYGSWAKSHIGSRIIVCLIVISLMCILGAIMAVITIFFCHKGQPFNLTRRSLTNGFSKVLWLTVAVVLLSLIDTFGKSGYAAYIHMVADENDSIIPFPKATFLTGLLGAVLAMTSRIMPLIHPRSANRRKRSSVSISFLAAIASALIAFAALSILSGVSYAFQWHGKVPPGDPGMQVLNHFFPREIDQPLKAAPCCRKPEDPRKDRTDYTPLHFDPNDTLPGGNLLWAAAFFALLAVGMGRCMRFVNLSSLHAFYGGRLTRAYLGATNPDRWSIGETTPIERGLGSDGISFCHYFPHTAGGPLHIVNVTINETIDGRSQLESRDRKGLNLAVGPAAFTAGASMHALRSAQCKEGDALQAILESHDFHAFGILEKQKELANPYLGEKIRPEQLDLGTWCSISGAAFGTGMGAGTSLGLSFLQCIAGLRIGYWWNSGVDPHERKIQSGSPTGYWLSKLFPVQSYIGNEMLARFHGFARKHWYLSDGGHFENTAAYELLRRKLKLIIVVDCGADPTYTWSDVGGLVHKARVDFGTKIEFLSDTELQSILPSLKIQLGSLESLTRTGEKVKDFNGRISKTHAALARVTYKGENKTGWLLLLKPSITGDEPVDVLQYNADHPSFPQEPTSDQFFDGLQWESYRCLGEHISSKLLTLDVLKALLSMS